MSLSNRELTALANELLAKNETTEKHDEISLLRAENEKLRAALRASALPSEEDIARVIVRTCEDVGENEDEFCSDRMALASARAVLTLIAKSKGCT